MLISIDPKALEHACQCAGRSVHHFDRMGDDLPLRASIIAHARAIEQHEAFRQEVSDAVHKHWGDMPCEFDRFIIAKPDPLVEVIATALREGSPFDEDGSHDYTAEAKAVASAIRARGLEVRKIGEKAGE